jgi:NAD(P)H-hydrate epimerase
MKLVTVAQMRAIEVAADATGHSYAAMMAAAGKSLADHIAGHSRKGGRIVGLVGSGNNGGDTLVALAHLARRGYKASAFIVPSRKRDAYLTRAKTAGVAIVSSQSSLTKQIAKADVIVDGLLGTGIRLPLRDDAAELLEAVGKALGKRDEKPLVVAVDCPSGMDCDTGQVAPQALRADLTVTMAAAKQGMLTLDAHEYICKLVAADIGLPSDLPEWKSIRRFVIDEEMAMAALRPRPPSAHKGTFGTALVVAGSRRYPGAALLAGEAAYRSGAGLVTIATVESMQPSLAGHLREATWMPLAERDGWIASEAAKQVAENLGRATAVLIGPGLGQEETTGDFLSALLVDLKLPCVFDADALKLLTRIPDWHKLAPADSVLTPHPGEMAILTGLTNKEVQADRIAIAEKFAKQWGHIVVLKGAFTVVAAPDGHTAVTPLATAALARAGTGDVLAGIITGLRAQGVPAFEAACSGVYLHGMAGLRAAERRGLGSVLAGDLLAQLGN